MTTPSNRSLLSRRDFVRSAALLPVIAASATAATHSATAPIQRAGGPRLKLGLNAYSFSDLLLENLKDKSKGLDLFQLCDYCAKHDFEAIDPTGYFFPGYPSVPDDTYIYALKRHAFDRGLAISGTGVRNDFTAADPAVRADGVKRVKAWVEVAAKLGAPVVRVFADCQAPFKTWQAASNNASRDAVEIWMAAAMQECAEHGAKYGVIIGIQNHGDFIATGAQHLSLLARVNHRWCGAIVDTGKYVTADPYLDIAQVAPVAVNWQVKESPFGRADRPTTDWKKLAAILRQSGYRGYVPIETLAMNRKDYDPYKLAAQVLRDMQAALAAS
jgi:sugar phosphate isomerase/epimerase